MTKIFAEKASIKVGYFYKRAVILMSSFKKVQAKTLFEKVYGKFQFLIFFFFILLSLQRFLLYEQALAHKFSHFILVPSVHRVFAITKLFLKKMPPS